MTYVDPTVFNEKAIGFLWESVDASSCFLIYSLIIAHCACLCVHSSIFLSCARFLSCSLLVGVHGTSHFEMGFARRNAPGGAGSPMGPVSLHLDVDSAGDGRVIKVTLAASNHNNVRMRGHVAGDASFLDLLFDHDQVRSSH
jgi:hypothetical protein